MINKHLWLTLIIVLLASICPVLFACSSSNNTPTSSIPITVPLPPATSNATTSTPKTIVKVSPDDVPRISIDELKLKMDGGSKIMIVDVRTKEEYAVDHIPGAVSAPFLDITAGNWYPTPGKEIILYCS